MKLITSKDIGVALAGVNGALARFGRKHRLAIIRSGGSNVIEEYRADKCLRALFSGTKRECLTYLRAFQDGMFFQ